MALVYIRDKMDLTTPTHSPGRVNIAVSNSFGSAISNGFRYLGPPVVSSLSKDGANTDGTTRFTINGTELDTVTGVTIANIPINSFTKTSTYIELTAPAHSAGPVDITITNPYGSTTLVGKFTYLSNTCLIRQSDITGNVEYLDSNAFTWTPIQWPFRLTKSTNLITDITIKNSNEYFIFNADNIVFDGKGCVVTVDGVSNYPGLFLNGYFVSNPISTLTWRNNGNKSITIKNLGVKTLNDSTLATNAGWIGQSCFGNEGNKIISCYSTGPIGPTCGGILGMYPETVSVSGCYSTGIIDNGGYGIAKTSYSTSIVAFGSGVTITNCYELNGGTWSDTNASTALVDGVPGTFPGVGTTWTSINANEPWVLTKSL